MYNNRKLQEKTKTNTLYICIDIAHGTLSSLYDICKNIKKDFGNKIIIMTGNIANPEAYIKYCQCGIDYVRCGIGSGSRCTSSCALGLHYAMASLLDDINEVKKEMKQHLPNYYTTEFKYTEIIADGGIGWYDDINKALALGADYVMIGKFFAECEEACGNKFYLKPEEYNLYIKGEIKGISKDYYDTLYDNLKNEVHTVQLSYERKKEITKALDELKKYKPYRDYQGMSTKFAQKITGGDGTKTSEGISKPVEIICSISKRINNIDSYLRSCMTYTNSRNLEEFKNAEVRIIGGIGESIFRK